MTIGFQNESYSLLESSGSAEVCISVLSGTLGTTFFPSPSDFEAVSVTVTSHTEELNATGWWGLCYLLSANIIIYAIHEIFGIHCKFSN